MRLLILLFFLNANVVVAQQADSMSYKYLNFLAELGVQSTEKYACIVMYPIQNAQFSDRHWIEHFFGFDHKYKKILFVIFYEHIESLKYLDSHIKSKPNLLVVNNMKYVKQEFYSYSPYYLSLENGKVASRVDIKIKNVYGDKYDLYLKYKD